MVEEPPGFEPGIAALQAAALPLGDGSTLIYTNIFFFLLNKTSEPLGEALVR